MTDRSIWEHVSAHVPADGPGLRPEGWVLPDEGGSGPPPAVPGAVDGVRLLFGGLARDDEAADEVTALLRAALATRKPRQYEALCERVAGSDVLTYLDPVLRVVPSFRASPERIYDLGRRMVTTAGDRALVKFGISLFGFFEAGYHIDVVLALGRHDEFTYYAVRALSGGLDNPEPKLWELAQNATGWGRIHAVRELAGGVRRPEVAGWLLREGYRNDVADAYLAYPVAVGASLARTLAGAAVDDELLDGAVDLLRGLLRGGPLGGMADYADGARATVLVVNQLRARAEILRDAMALTEIDGFVQRPLNWSALAAAGWTPEVRRSLNRDCQAILAWPIWPAAVAEAIESSEEGRWDEAVEVADLLDIDILPSVLRRLDNHPLDPPLWHYVMAQADEDNFATVLDLALARLPLAEIATGPGALVGHDAAHAAHESLDAVLSGLIEWPGRGWSIVWAGLSSPVVRNRNLALRVLAGWSRSAWPPDAEAQLRTAANIEPEPEVRRRIGRLLAGKPLEQGARRPN